MNERSSLIPKSQRSADLDLRYACLRAVVLVSFLAAGCASADKPFLYFHPEVTKESPESLLEKAEALEKEPFDNIKLETISQNELSTHHLVIVKKEEPLHYHATHDGWAICLKGEGEFILGDKRFPIHPNSSIYIPRGIPHKAIRKGKEPIAAFVIFTPPYDGKDTVPVEQK